MNKNEKERINEFMESWIRLKSLCHEEKNKGLMEEMGGI